MQVQVSGVGEYLWYLPRVLIYDPLRVLYFRGPQLWGLGGWAGMSPEDICAQLTSVPAMSWRMHRMSDCWVLLETRFETFAISFWAIIYAVALYKIISMLWFRYFIIAPIISELKSIYSCHLKDR